MARYVFLSLEWIAAAKALQADAGEEPATVTLQMNLVVEEVPFGEGTLDAHLDTTSGALDIDLGHLERADVRVLLDYETAKRVLVDQDAEAAMSAFMAGKVRVEGDMTKLLTYQATPPNERQQALADAVREITA
ncbi:MAG TPA: SCP2 sterol-binding domain-containing protein [Acidimicrobiales bacterium]|nr:SCP2 sterol-binding domain-containing protein [Acidimicrobiales bacterium]